MPKRLASAVVVSSRVISMALLSSNPALADDPIARDHAGCQEGIEDILTMDQVTLGAATDEGPEEMPIGVSKEELAAVKTSIAACLGVVHG